MKLLLEIGCEEIPARFIGPALESMGGEFARRIEQERLNTQGGVNTRVMGTPRRLALLADGISERQTDIEEEVLGPRVEAAYDPDGRPTKACLGFARGKGVDHEELEQIDTAKGKVVGFRRKIEGLDSASRMPVVLTGLLESLSFPKTMRWGTGEHAFARPVHWILALLDEKPVELEFAGVKSACLSRGHRFLEKEAFEIHSPDDYVECLRQHHVIVDPSERHSGLMQEVRALAESAGGRLVEDEGLEEEVTFLIERYVPLLGRFDERFLKLPREVLIAAMRNHQRYFSVESHEGELLSAFIAVANTPADNPDVVRHGFERVLTARLSDAEFFFETDSKKDPADLVEDLDEMIFQADLGGYLDKARRMSRLATFLSGWLDESGAEREKLVEKACMLAKTDLLTEMVGEFPELQGVMGGVYAEKAGYDRLISQAIREHYRPRFHSDSVPESDEGAIVSLADRLDTLAGCFGVGLRPTGTADPFALRRQCLGVIAILLGKEYHISLQKMIEAAVGGVQDKVGAALLYKARRKEKKRAARKKEKPRQIDEVPSFESKLTEDLKTFFAGRLRQRMAEDTGARPDVIDAVLGAGYDDIVDAWARVVALAAFMGEEAFEDLAVAFKRVANIIKDFEGAELNKELFEHEEEKLLQEVFESVAPRCEKLLDAREFDAGLRLLAEELRKPVDRFFDAVLVNDPDDPGRQANRKAMLAGIERLFGRFADFTRLQVKGMK